MAKILLSIKPIYVERIFSGEKKFEYRTIVPLKKIDKIIIYASDPISKVVGEFTVKDIMADLPEIIWSLTNSFGPGISKEEYDQYYKGKDQAVAFVIDEVKKYKKPKTLKDFKLTSAPQNYVYIK